MAERSYLRTAKNLGGADDLAQKWASAVMYQLREQVEERVLARRKVLTALWEELAATPAQAEATKEAQKAGIAHARANDNGTKFRGRKPTFTWDTLVIVQDLFKSGHGSSGNRQDDRVGAANCLSDSEGTGPTGSGSGFLVSQRCGGVGDAEPCRHLEKIFAGSDPPSGYSS